MAATKPRILVVEDELIIRLFLVEALEEAGYDVVEAASGDHAAKELDGPDGFRVLLTDLHMPGTLDGFALARRAREKDPNIAVLYMTGRPDALQPLGAISRRDAVLLKPYGPSQVLEVVSRLIGEPPANSRSDSPVETG
jgi:CheY-like chemotaxis protein